MEVVNELVAFLDTWVNILPKNPYLAKRGFLEKLILLKSKKDDFREN